MIKNNNIKKIGIVTVFAFIFLLFALSPVHAEEYSSGEYGINKNYKTQPVRIPNTNTYSITPNSEPCDRAMIKFSTYNRYTKNYYTIRSYMEKFEKERGGTLILKKGKYVITNTIAIPSNVNLIFEDGVVIEKGTVTGTSQLKASTSVFHIVPPSKFHRKNACSKYNGASNVNIIGKGTSTIDLKYLPAAAIVSGHNKNININGITFKNLYSGHFIDMGAVNNIKISNCKFIGSKPTSGLGAEAINIDIPDANTKGFNSQWSTQDKTNNNRIIIENNVFNLLDRAIGSHKYSQRPSNGKYVVNKGQIYHTNIFIKNNVIMNTRADPIHIRNWKNVEITNNYIANVPKNSREYRGILGTGANIKIKHNYFVNMFRPAQFMPAKNTGAGSMYSITYNDISSQNMEDLKYNLCSNVNENFVYVSNNINAYYNGARIAHMFTSSNELS